MYLTLRGVPLHAPPSNGELFFSFDPQGAWSPSACNRAYEVETECVVLHEAFAAAIFGTYKDYYDALRVAPEFVLTAGLNSESLLPRIEFERLVGMPQTTSSINRLLYATDCSKLVASIQECTKEVMYLQGEFYRALNLDQLFFPDIEEPDGVRWLTSPVVTNIHATLSFIFIRLHSLLDYTTKLVFEAENLRSDFSSYPRLAANNILFGDRKKIAMNGRPNTLFEPCEMVTEVEVFRNHIIHDGLLDDMPKAYKVKESGEVIEKFILLPDRGPRGHLEKFKSRNLFYSGEDKINLRLPSFISEFQQRLVGTLQGVLILLKQQVPPSEESSSSRS